MPKTSELTVQIDKEQLDGWAKERISNLENDLGRALKREERAKKKIKELEGRVEIANEIINIGEDFGRDLVNLTDIWGEFDRA